ncbi:MAG: hypothetical protein RL661_863 [Pseudomonadota bacterium]|jgi:hypothetical protein
MALYRHTATGFLGEFASNPGAGYTAVTAMPTDTVANRVTWWRGLDTYGQTSSWHPSVTRDPQDPGEATISIQFSQDAALISSDPDGTVTNPRDPGNTYYLGASTEVRVYRGLTDVTITEGWTLTKVEEGCTSTLAEAGGLYTLKITDIPLLATQSGYVRITATRDGSGTFVKDFRFLKVFQGQDGSSGNVIDLTNENHTIPTDADGNNGNYTGATTTASLFIGGTDDSANWTWTVTPSAGITGTATNSNRTYTVTAMSVDAGTVTFKANKTGESERSAVFTLSKAKGGIAYSLDISAGSISKSNAGVYNPASLTINATKVTTSGVSAYSGRIRIQTQATLGGAWTTQYTSASDEASTTYAIPANIVAVKVILYQAGGVTTILDQESIPVVFDGADGSSGIVMDLDNENQTVAALKDGTWISGTTATTTARLYLGATQLTSGITWSVASATAGITYTTTNNTSSYTVNVTNMTAALVSGTVTVRATFNGVNYDQVFTISKANAGSDGTPATVYWLDTSASAIAKDKTGTYNPTSITINAYSQTGTNAQVAYTGRFRVQTQATLNGAWTTRYDSAGNESSASYSIPASIVAVKVLLYQAGGTTTLLDQETLPVVSDGQDGATGTRGSRQIVISGTSWSDAAAWNGIITQFGGTTPVLSDLVTIANAASGFSVSKFYTGGAYDGDWVEPSAYINGNLLVTGTVGANAIAANAITAGKIAAGAVNLTNLTFTPVQTSSVVASINASAEGVKIAGSLIRIDGNVTFGSGYDPSTKLSAGGAATDINNNVTTINGNKITTGTLTADKIYGGTLDASTITVTNLSASSITGGTLNGTNVSVTNLNATNITTGTLNGVRVGTGINGGNINDASITNAKIASLSAGKITTGSLSSTVIDLVGSAAVIKTSNFALGTGFRISGDGNAFFYGAAVSGSARSTNWNGTINGTTGQPTAGTGTQGWCIDNAGNCEFNTVHVRTKNIEAGGVTSSGGYGAAASTILSAGQTATFWTPNQAAVTYGRGNIAFLSSLVLKATGIPTGSAIVMNYRVNIVRAGTTVRTIDGVSGTLTTNGIFHINIQYFDTSKSDAAAAYTFNLTNTSGYAFQVIFIDEFWVEYKR